MSKKIENKIIVIGGSHHNMLGVVRGLGLRGLDTTAIITNDKPYSFVAKSKFIEKAYVVNADKNKVLETLKMVTKELPQKAIIIPTSDFAAELLDENYDILKKHCILPSINKKQGEIVRYMDKYEQYNLAQKYGIKIAKSAIVKLDGNKEELHFEAKKYILKPIVSASGSKSDIRICDNSSIKRCLDEFREKGYLRILVQEFLEFDDECMMMGCIARGNIILPGLVRKIRIYPLKRGTSSYAFVEKVPKNVEIEKIKKLLTALNYEGMFDVEIFLKNDDVYLNEINFRNSGSSFSYQVEGISVIYLWILQMVGMDIGNEKTEICKSFSFIDERTEMKHLVQKNISLKEYLLTRRQAKARLLHCRKDIKPSVYKIIYAIRNRITR